MLTGARSAFQLKKFIEDSMRSKGLKVDETFKLFDGIQMPSLIKYETNSNADKSIIDVGFKKDIGTTEAYQTVGCEIISNDINKSSVRSFPLHLISTYNGSKSCIFRESNSLAQNIDEFKMFSKETLVFEKIKSFDSVLEGSILETNKYGYKRYIAGKKEERDGVVCLGIYEVFYDKNVDGLYYYEVDSPPIDFGWIHNISKQLLYIPRKVNVPNQIRIALQCAVGSYTSTCFVEPLERGIYKPKLNNGQLSFMKELQKGSIEMEVFTGITPNLLSAIEKKLNILTKKIN
jgi:hypothetical protein